MKILQKITAVSLAIVFLLSSLGFTVNKMFCLKTGKAELSLVTIEDCCLKKQVTTEDDCCEENEIPQDFENTTYISKADCCDILNTSFDLSDFQTVKNNSIPSALSSDLILIPNDLISLQPKLTESRVEFNNFSHHLHGRDLLSHISILII